MDRPAGAVTGQAREAEAFGDDPLPRERRVAVEEDRQYGIALMIAAQRLDRARLAEHDGVDRLEVARVGDEAQVDLIAVELAVGRGAEVIFDIARPADVVGVGAPPGEFVEDRAVRLAHDVGENIQAPAVRHPDGDLGDPHRAAIFDD